MIALRELYQNNARQFVDFVNSFPNDDLQGPLLAQPTAYFNQTKKLLIVGQETFGWSCFYEDIDAQLKEYVNFNMGETYRSTPFWNLTRKVESLIGIERCSCAWTNLNRFDSAGRAPTGAILEKMPVLDYLLKEEIHILAPDICLFYTNWKYDHRLESLYPGLKFQDIDGLPTGHFSQLIHKNLPNRSFRTPHPKTIRIRKWEEAFLAMVNLKGNAAHDE